MTLRCLLAQTSEMSLAYRLFAYKKNECIDAYEMRGPFFHLSAG